MNPHQVRTWEAVEQWLRSKGFVPTQHVVEGGGATLWRSKSGRHLSVPDHIDGMYPEYFFNDLWRRARQIVP